MKKKTSEKIKYAVIGLGHIAQAAVLPAFRNSENSELCALVSGDRQKLKTLAKKYKVERTYSYEEFDHCLREGSLDAVYIALPNHLHKECAIQVAECGLHILCEKPLAVTSRDAEAMILAAQYSGVKLMTAYRLHFDPMNLQAVELIESDKIGKPLFFTSEFGHTIKENNIRATPEEGGNPLYDLGVYCINAARYLFRSEPIEVMAMAVNATPRLPRIDQSVAAILRFPKDRVATFICSFASAEASNYRVIGTKGDLFIQNPYEYHGEMSRRLSVDGRTTKMKTRIGDQFAAEISYFSDCLLNNRDPEPSGTEGLIDVQIIEALNQSLVENRPIILSTRQPAARPTIEQQIRKPPHAPPPLFHAEPAGR